MPEFDQMIDELTTAHDRECDDAYDDGYLNALEETLDELESDFGDKETVTLEELRKFFERLQTENAPPSTNG